MEIQSTSEMTPYFTMTKCNKLFITYHTRSTERLPTLPSSITTISTISMTVVMTTLFNTRVWCSEQGRYVINIYICIGIYTSIFGVFAYLYFLIFFITG